MLKVHDEKVPLTDKDGELLVRDTRVSLRCIVEMFDAGSSAEEIADEYDLDLPDVYSVVGYYLRHQKEVQSHLTELEQESEFARKELDAKFPSALREKLERAKKERDAGDD